MSARGRATSTRAMSSGGHTDRKPSSRPDPLDHAGITYVDYKDTGLPRKFLSDRGKIPSRRVTRVGARQQRQPARAIKNAREMGPLPYRSAPR
jgi:small subunit ribosomal protein S18